MGANNSKFSVNIRNYENFKIIKTKINVEHAKTDEEITKGLMFRDNLEKNTGMLFHMKKKFKHSFWMKNTQLPLDVIFLDKKPLKNNHFRIVGFIENTTPYSLKSISINEPSSFVLEMNANWVKNNNAQIGDTIVIANAHVKL